MPIHPHTILRQVLSERSEPLRRFLAELETGKKPIVLERLPGSALPFVLAEAMRVTNRPLLVLTPGVDRAEDFVGDLEFFGVKQALHFPKWEVLPYDDDDLSLEITAKSLDVFEHIHRRRTDPKSPPWAICAPTDALMLKVLPEARMNELLVRVRWGDRMDLPKLVERLEASGYERQPLVEARGEYSVRGGILDLYPLNAEVPIRLDFFGDEIESIRTFDAITQRSLGDLGTGADLVIPPARLKWQINEFLKGGGELESLLDHLPEDTIVVLDSPERNVEVCTYFQNAVERQYENARKRVDNPPPPARLMLTLDELPVALKKFRRIEHSLHLAEAERGTTHIKFDAGPYAADTTELDSWVTTIKKFQEKDFFVAIACDNDGQVQRFDELLREKHIAATMMLESGWSDGDFKIRSVLSGKQEVLLFVGGVQTSFNMPDVRLLVLTDREIFGRYKRRYIYKKIHKGKPISTSGDIRRGDFVVHVDHGIGRFLGMRVQELDGRMTDLIEIEYADNDKLLVPVDKIHRVQKYAGPESAEPTLDKLGGGKWAKRRQKNSEEIERMANELLQLYAERELATREPHKADTPLQREFESSFLYQETPDQMKAIIDSKTDMEKTRPMDRLVCGDVGYGKTEVAIRTIFKCVQSGRQALLLCPTTILAQQHHNNLRERFADYPVRIDMISRFKSPAEIKAIKKKLKAGELDVVIGTHGLLAKDMEVPRLGLVVVDEEQRFGVKAKERLKEMRTEVDMLTLSATPIPRTLHMALSGLRDLSLITTPPPDRQPIKTRLIPFSEEEISEAILRELNRGGQVYFVHNRVATIQEVEKRLKEIVPHARITHAHGQMDEETLENTMIKFINHEFDILVATTIIESGVDIPNCNTMIINRADAFGLAQLYQLRGRVGREKRRAYAYLIVPPGKAITEAAVKRLAAIEEFAELGVGFSIAMRDLEIRGAGDILGKAQHGAITEIGFELFCEMLQDRVREKRGDTVDLWLEVEVRWDAGTFLPPQYIPLEAHRVTFYKRFASARSMQELEDVEVELRDRFGELPEPAKTLLHTYRVRMSCQLHRIASVKKSMNKIRLTFVQPHAREREAAFRAAAKGMEGILNVLADTMDQMVVTLSPAAAINGSLPVLEALLEAAAKQ